MQGLCCDNTTEYGEDEIYIIVVGKYSNGDTFGYRLPGETTHWDMNDGGDKHCISNVDLATFDLNEGESISIVISIMEEDGGNPQKYTNIVAGILGSTTNPYGIAAGTIISIIGNVLPHDSDDWIGTFACQISRQGNDLAVDWRPVNRVSGVINEIHGHNTCEFRMNGDGSNYVGWYHII